MAISRLQSNLRFALYKEDSKTRDDIPLNRLEKIGNVLSWFIYEFKSFFAKTFFDVRCITVYFTILAMILTALLFYPSDTWNILSEACEWIFDHINWSYVRFALWFLSEITIFGLGIRSFGRFSNRKLMAHHGIAL